MKKYVVAIIISLLVLFSVTFSIAQPKPFGVVQSSGEQTSDATIYTGACLFFGIEVITDGTNAATAIVYDNTANSGTKLVELVVAGASNFGGGLWPHPVYCSTGIRVDLSGTGASAIVYYTVFP